MACFTFLFPDRPDPPFKHQRAYFVLDWLHILAMLPRSTEQPFEDVENDSMRCVWHPAARMPHL